MKYERNLFTYRTCFDLGGWSCWAAIASTLLYHQRTLPWQLATPTTSCSKVSKAVSAKLEVFLEKLKIAQTYSNQIKTLCAFSKCFCDNKLHEIRWYLRLCIAKHQPTANRSTKSFVFASVLPTNNCTRWNTSRPPHCCLPIVNKSSTKQVKTDLPHYSFHETKIVFLFELKQHYASA